MRQPTLYPLYDGGPCFFMEWTMGSAGLWASIGQWLGGIAESLPERVRHPTACLRWRGWEPGLHGCRDPQGCRDGVTPQRPAARLRVRAVVFGLAIIGTGCTAVVEATDDPPEATECPPTEGPFCFTVAWAGDTLLADAALPALEENGYLHPFEFVEDLLDADLAIGNAEGPITVITEPYNEGQTWSYNAAPAAANALAEVGFDALSLANNHLNDRGPDGIADTLVHLDAAGVAGFGGGLDRGEALEPFIFEAPSGPVAVFGFGKNSQWVPPAGAGPGQLLLSSTNIVAAIEVADELGATYRVAFPHWGSNYSVVSQQQRDQAQLFIDAGFDLVIGHGPHNQQGVEIIDGVPVLWSLGNFAFGTPGRWDDAFPGFGLVAHTKFGEEGIEAITLTCISTDNDVVQFQPRPCEVDAAADVLGALGEVVEVIDGVGHVVLPSL